MKFISLFSGIGGFDLALERLGHTCVYANDIDKYCKIIYDKHFETKQTTQDIRTVKSTDIPYHDLLVGGFPCQSFSVAGKRGGFADTRGTLFFEIARILKEKQPRLFILENVKGLLSHDQGKTFTTIIATLDELGYDLQWQVLNSKNFGVPQNRERVFIIGHLRGTPRTEIFPIGESKQTSDGALGLQSVRQTAGTLGATDYKGTHNNIREISLSLDANYWKGIDNHGQRTAIVQRQPLKFLQRNQRNIEGDYSFTADTSNTNGVRVGSGIRRLTPRECERLQGFPDGWTEGVSDTQRYKMCGNAVTVNVVYEIARRLK